MAGEQDERSVVWSRKSGGDEGHNAPQQGGSSGDAATRMFGLYLVVGFVVALVVAVAFWIASLFH